VLEVVDDTLAVEEIHRGSQKVPVVPKSVRYEPSRAKEKGKSSSTYQFKDFVNLKLLALLGTFEIAIT